MAVEAAFPHEREDVKGSMADLARALSGLGCGGVRVDSGKGTEQGMSFLTIENRIGTGHDFVLGWDNGAQTLWIGLATARRTDHNTNTWIQAGEESDNGMVTISGEDPDNLTVTVSADHPIARFVGLLQTLCVTEPLDITLRGDSGGWDKSKSPKVTIKDSGELVVSGAGEGNAKLAIPLGNSDHISSVKWVDGDWIKGATQSLKIGVK